MPKHSSLRTTPNVSAQHTGREEGGGEEEGGGKETIGKERGEENRRDVGQTHMKIYQ